jgi:hypothetical protein
VQRSFALVFVDGETARDAQAHLAQEPLAVRVFSRRFPQDPATDSVVVAMLRESGGDGDNGDSSKIDDPNSKIDPSSSSSSGGGGGSSSNNNNLNDNDSKDSKDGSDDTDTWWTCALALSHESCFEVLDPYLDAVSGRLRGVMQRELHALLIVDPEWGANSRVWAACAGFFG